MRSKTWFLRMASIFTLLTAAQPVLASQSTGGQVTDIILNSYGYAAFTVSGTRTTKPACATSDRWVFDTTTPLGQARLAQLLTAFSLKSTVTVGGSDSCPSGSGASQSESVDNLKIV